MPIRLQNSARNRTAGLCVSLGWGVYVACDRGHSRRWTVADLAAQFPADVTLEAIAERLVCRAETAEGPCGCHDGELSIFQDVDYTTAREIEAFNRSGKYER